MITSILPAPETPGYDSPVDLYFDQLKDVAFAADGKVRLTIGFAIANQRSGTLLDNIYYPDFDGLIHLDLQELVRMTTSVILPDFAETKMVNAGTVFQHYADVDLFFETDMMHYFEMHDDDSTYHEGRPVNWVVHAFAFESGAAERMTDIDAMTVPRNYRGFRSLLQETDTIRGATITTSLESGHRREQIGTADTNASEDTSYWGNDPAYIFTRPYEIDGLDPEEPFRLVYELTRSGMEKRVYATPVLQVGKGQFEMYIFLNRYGNFDTVACSGALTYAPEFEVESAERIRSVERTKGVRRDAWMQNTGPQSRKTLEALAELLLSPQIFRYIPGETPRRIIVENPTLTVSSKSNVNTATFTWRYAEQ